MDSTFVLNENYLIIEYLYLYEEQDGQNYSQSNLLNLIAITIHPLYMYAQTCSITIRRLNPNGTNTYRLYF